MRYENTDDDRTTTDKPSDGRRNKSIFTILKFNFVKGYGFEFEGAKTDSLHTEDKAAKMDSNLQDTTNRQECM